jgi:hypothetical protein
MAIQMNLTEKMVTNMSQVSEIINNNNLTL